MVTKAAYLYEQSEKISYIYMLLLNMMMIHDKFVMEVFIYPLQKNSKALSDQGSSFTSMKYLEEGKHTR